MNETDQKYQNHELHNRKNRVSFANLFVFLPPPPKVKVVFSPLYFYLLLAKSKIFQVHLEVYFVRLSVCLFIGLTLPVILPRLAKWVPACWYPVSEWRPVQDLCPIAKESALAAPMLCTEYGPNGWMDLHSYMPFWRVMTSITRSKFVELMSPAS